MNIFVLDRCAHQAARYHCDKHVVKMIVEYAQMLSTAHRFHDGTLTAVELPDGKQKRLRLLTGETTSVIPRLEPAPRKGPAVTALKRKSPYTVEVNHRKCYLEAHAKHPCTVWTGLTDSNYRWLYALFDACLKEYERRYHRQHGTSKIAEFLSAPPTNIASGSRTPFALAMPEEYKHDDAVEAYRRFYAGSKVRFAKWKNTPVPDWFKHLVEGQNATHLSTAP